MCDTAWEMRTAGLASRGLGGVRLATAASGLKVDQAE